jgi:hypothetical protein
MLDHPRRYEVNESKVLKMIAENTEERELVGLSRNLCA